MAERGDVHASASGAVRNSTVPGNVTTLGAMSTTTPLPGARFVNFLQEFSIPLLAGVVAGLAVANIDEQTYHWLVELPVFGEGAAIWGHELTLHFLINDVFMVFFFGIATKEITESVLPGGALNPPAKAINPILATLGGVIGPVGVYLLLVVLQYGSHPDFAAIRHGWGIPTATDIALAWLVARMCFGAGHAAVKFLLLLAIADDAIGLVIIAVFYPDPVHPVRLSYMLLVVAGMGVALALRLFRVRSWYPYVFFGGLLSWAGFLNASLHPALALVPIVPFMPGPSRDPGLFVEEIDRDEEYDAQTGEIRVVEHVHHDTLSHFEHEVKLPVDMGLFFFAFANAGVAFAEVNALTAIVLVSLVVGKTVGITLFGALAARIGFPLPEGMGTKHLVTAGMVGGIGLTVALFVAGQAFPPGNPWQGPAKMGAVLSFSAAIFAVAMSRAWKLRQR